MMSTCSKLLHLQNIFLCTEKMKDGLTTFTPVVWRSYMNKITQKLLTEEMIQWVVKLIAMVKAHCFIVERLAHTQNGVNILQLNITNLRTKLIYNSDP